MDWKNVGVKSHAVVSSRSDTLTCNGIPVMYCDSLSGSDPADRLGHAFDRDHQKAPLRRYMGRSIRQTDPTLLAVMKMAMM
ncbi:hypothetical protein EVAR_68536_1 [Eumeta japonica]|uniref:Uncharacterized protein n=1 Tax=Eumeta variegata TaxID=151549 RepID=A0A4C1ZXR2_EUMVA|nr:hypothetical protein EVAR_68536_1 [Eumeta japonica]